MLAYMQSQVVQHQLNVSLDPICIGILCAKTKCQKIPRTLSKMYNIRPRPYKIKTSLILSSLNLVVQPAHTLTNISCNTTNLYNMLDNGGSNMKELPQHSFTTVESEASTPPTPPLAWSTEIPLPTSKHVNRQE